MKDSKSVNIPLFYWSSIKFEGRIKENYGDLLSKYLIEKISSKNVKWVHPRKQPWYKWNKKNFLAIGSILAHATKDSIVWGSGIIDQTHHVAEANFKAVRGPKTREFLLEKGYTCPEVYGDPALLLPLYYSPERVASFKIGIIPHYVDFPKVKILFEKNPDIHIIDVLTMDIERTTKEILSCERILSSSLHGVIVSHAYGIPAVRVKFSDKIFGDGVKYKDYFESVEMDYYEAEEIDKPMEVDQLEKILGANRNLPVREKIIELQEGLLKNSPF